MSRIGKQPIAVPAGVTVKIDGTKVSVKGPKGGPLERDCHPNCKVELGKIATKKTDKGDEVVFTPDAAGNVIRVTRKDDERFSRSLHGLTRTLVANMVEGVTKGFEKKLKIEGVGYQAKLDKKSVVLMVGYANQIVLEPPEGVTAEVPDPTTIIVRGADKEKVGQFAAEIRHAKPPEPYQGKGVRYENEVVRRKEGKSFAAGAK
jgi:large subunit ribosomal protein L6